MKNFILLLLTSLLLFSCVQTNKGSQKIALATKYRDITSQFIQKNDTIYVVNFWATWCKPCVEEMPLLMKINNKYASNQNFKMILVSLDKPADFETKVAHFIEEHHIKTDVYILNDDANKTEWVRYLNPHWGGTIPATFIYKNEKQWFFTDKPISYKELKSKIDELM